MLIRAKFVCLGTNEVGTQSPEVGDIAKSDREVTESNEAVI
jgi:hypothetical protein